MTEKEKNELQITIPYITHEAAMARAERTIKRLTIGIILITILSILAIWGATYTIDKGWRDYFSECDISSYDYSQDGGGVNIVGNSNGVDYNGAESKDQADNTEGQNEN